MKIFAVANYSATLEGSAAHNMTSGHFEQLWRANVFKYVWFIWYNFFHNATATICESKCKRLLNMHTNWLSHFEYTDPHYEPSDHFKHRTNWKNSISGSLYYNI